MTIMKNINFKFVWMLVLFVKSGNCQDFGYEGDEGPIHWGEKYSKCVGKHQSPIDIEEDHIDIVKFPKLVFEHFDKRLEAIRLENNGHTVMLSITQGKIPRIHGGPLRGIYKFAQLHFHWGEHDTEGSETLINNRSFPLELHMVFYKKQYEEFQNALNYDDGLTVLSFLYSVSEEDNENYDQFENGLIGVQNYTSITEMFHFVSLDQFTTTNREDYFAYEGSLTTPPCSEIVMWVEFKNTIPLSHSQLMTFRTLYSRSGHLTHNFRPTQPIHDRIIYMNYSGTTKMCLNILLIIIVQIILCKFL